MAFRMKAVFLAAGMSAMVSPIAATAVAAQSRDGSDQRYEDQQYDPRYDDRQYDPRDDRGGDPRYAADRGPPVDDRYYDESYDRAPPPGYDGTRPPPPPRGWTDDGGDSQYQVADDRFADDAERWAMANCVKSQNNAGVGAVVGGVIGALVGNGVSGRGNRTGGTIAGAAIGAVGGAAVGSASGNQTSPGCPPGYVVRGGAAAFQYGAYYGPGYAYAAPVWYRPWVFNAGRWVYRPYPYHRFYARHYRPYRWGRPVYRRGVRRTVRRRW